MVVGNGNLMKIDAGAANDGVVSRVSMTVNSTYTSLQKGAEPNTTGRVTGVTVEPKPTRSRAGLAT